MSTKQVKRMNKETMAEKKKWQIAIDQLLADGIPKAQWSWTLATKPRLKCTMILLRATWST